MRITVLITAYNVEAYIERAIRSVLGQTRPAEEIIVVDDGSSDGTAAKVKLFADKLRYIRQDNAGANAARNTGIIEARGEWIALLDGDDEWLPDKLHRQCQLLEQHSGLAWTAGNYYRCSCAENRRGMDLTPEKLRKLQPKGYFNSWFEAFAKGAWGHTDTMLIQKKALEEAGLFRVGQLWADDLDMWFRIAYLYPQAGYLPEPLAIHHFGTGTITRTPKPVEMFIEMIDRHLHLSNEQGQSDQFRPCAQLLLHRLLRGFLFENRPQDIRKMLEHFPALLAPGYRWRMKTLARFPGMTQILCKSASKLIRTFHLRRQLQRKP